MTDDASIFRSIVNYNKKAADDIVSHYNEAVYDNNALARTNTLFKPAASTDVLPFCFGIAANPSRVRIFKNRMTCDREGFKTLFIFTAHTKKDIRHAPHPICTGFASAPDRSLFFSNRTTCDLGGFKTDFAFYESGQKGPNKPDITSLHESSVMWQTFNPHRMMLYPYYDGSKLGWRFAYNLQYRSLYRLSTSKEIAFLKKNLAKHEAVAMKLRVSSTPDVATRRCVRNMILAWNGLAINPSVPNILTGKTLRGFVASAARDKCSHLVSKSAIRISRVSVKGFGSLEIAVGSKVYAAISLEGNINVAIVHLQAALQESARTARPVPIAADKKQSDFAVALIAGTIVTMGGRQVYNHPI
ncbi:hypothetical protein BGX23_002774 [Mortierella sp. AD031]|nr:hypothetical protein BGX23_002774 [Mortierella sp. AD031]